MPAIPIAESRAPIVVGISATSSAIRTVCETGRAGVDGVRPQGHDAARKVIVRPGEQDVERDLVRRLAALCALDERDHPVEERLARLLGDHDDELVGEELRAAGDGRAVAARLADDRRRLARDRRLVDRADALDHLAVGRDHLAGLDDDDVAALQLGGRDVLEPAASEPAVRDRRRSRRAQRVRLRLAAPLGDRLGEVREEHRQPEPDGDRRRRTRGCPCCPRKSSRKKMTVVITLPSSTMNITGFRNWSRGSSFGNESRIAAKTMSREKMLPARGPLAGLLVECEVQLEDVDARLAEEAERSAVRVVVDQLLRRVSSGSPRTAAMRGAWSSA